MKQDLSRRGFVIAGASAAASALAACAGGSVAPPPQPSDTTYDVIVVGAGAAGIGAARTVASYGRTVLLLEAQDRAGGRARTDNTTFTEVPFDLGAQFFGHVRSGNVLYGVGQSLGLQLVDFTSFPTVTYLGTSPAPSSETASFVATAGSMIAQILAQGALISSPAEDYPVSNITDAYTGDAYYENAVSVTVETETGALPNVSSTLDLFNFTQASPAPFLTAGDSFVVRSGMGNFIASLANGLPLLTNRTVSRISSTSSGVTVETNNGTYRASAAVVTTSTGVLAAGGLVFSPVLPAAMTNAIAALPLGVVYKAALGFSHNPFPFTGMTIVTQLSSAASVTYFTNFWGTNVVEVLIDADLAVQVEGMSRSGQINYLLGRIAQNFPSAPAAFDGRFTASNWASNQYTVGSYSRARVGMSDARATLRQSVGNKLFFAGEALAVGGNITLLQGAYNSGIAAATGALHAIGIAVSIPSIANIDW
jgi:monoamine oxidase